VNKYIHYRSYKLPYQRPLISFFVTQLAELQNIPPATNRKHGVFKMTDTASTINKDICDRFLPLSTIPNHLRDELLQHAMTASFDVYSNIIKHSEKKVLYHYLVDGYADVRHSFDKRTNISSSDPKCVYPLEELIKGGGVVRAITPCKVLIINRSYLDDILTRTVLSTGTTVEHIEDDLLSKTALTYETSNNNHFIDDNYKADWMSLFYRSPLAMNLSPTQTQQVFSKLENIDVCSGDTIIQCHTKGNFFYILKEGYAEVVSEKFGPFKGQSFELEPGDYFGDEALVAQTIRNANVIMTSDGILGRMSQSDFKKTIKSALVTTPTADELDAFHNPIYCDVRLPLEYKMGHLPHSINIPVGKIRKNLDSFDKNLIYIITPEGGLRSELAVYLMRQSGIEAYYMNEDLQNTLPSLQSKIAS